ncbi:methylmalonyl-CoA epimerase [Bacillus oleivorans]|uniref:Methylmalonyl-CoA epimerase n=1 Tax=Bacillus oleivorans TaxID=1448271 RepID=A0A285CGY3_9BACI|nr:VOC family protein [Bacillus oleivorans]SNX66857.1 methylmalonyl-CoA epimerase [Bacillus oleivorans]
MKWHHIGIQVKELERSISFYQTNFGFNEEIRFQYEDEQIVFLTRETIRIELIESRLESRKAEQLHFSWQVENLDEWVDQLKINPIEGPITLPNGWRTVFYQGPDQELIELFQNES